MFSRNYKIFLAVINSIVFFAVFFAVTWAGSLNPTSAPGDTMFTLEQIYCRLTGCTATSYGLDSPANPAGTMYDLTDVWNVAPDFKNSPGDAATANVAVGKTFFINSSTKQTGTASLTGNAATGNVKSGYTFYSNSFTKQTGTAAYILTCYGSVPVMTTGSDYCAALGLNCIGGYASSGCVSIVGNSCSLQKAYLTSVWCSP